MEDITTSIYSFENIINGGCVYVDKTAEIYEVIKVQG